MSKARKAVPTFASEAEERAFWERADSTADLDWSRAQRARMPNLQPSTTAISLRLPIGSVGADQDRRSQARRALSIADQNVAEREGGVRGRATRPNGA